MFYKYMNNLNFNRNEIQDQKQIPLKNSNISNSNIFNMQNLSSSSSSYDFMGLFILIAMLIKACAQIPIIIKVTQTKDLINAKMVTMQINRKDKDMIKISEIKKLTKMRYAWV